MSFIHTSEDVEIFRTQAASATVVACAQDRSKGSVHVRLGMFDIDFQMSPVQHSIMQRMLAGYDADMVENVLRPVLEQRKDAPSIRSIDWCLTNYAKANSVYCTQLDGQRVNLYVAYKSALKFYRRRNFDAFRRKLRIVVRSPHGDLVTTIAQLNFYHWAHHTGVLRFCAQHAALIEADMNRVASLTKQFKSSRRPGERRRSELSKANQAKVNILS